MSILFKLFKALNANQYSSQIAFSFVLGMIMGLTPLFFAHNLVTLAFVFFLRVNLSALIVAFVAFSGLAYLLDPIFNQLGLMLLNEISLTPLFTEMYNNAFWRILHFNNSVVIGSVIVAYLLAIPAFILFFILVKSYRKRFLVWAKKLKIVQWIKRSEKIKLVIGMMK